MFVILILSLTLLAVAESQNFDFKVSINTIKDIIYSSDGKLITGGLQDHLIKIWDPKSWRLNLTIDTKNLIWGLEALPNGEFASTYNHSIAVWNPNLDKVNPIKILTNHTNDVYSLLYLQDGLFLSGSADKNIILWNLTMSNDPIRIFRGHTDRVRSLVSLPNGLLASASTDKTIKIWNLTLDTCLNTLMGHVDEIYALVVLPNGNLASSSRDYSIKIWNITKINYLVEIKQHSGWVVSLILLPNNILVSGSVDATIKFWDIDNNYKNVITLNGIKAMSLFYSPNLKAMFSGSDTGILNVWLGSVVKIQANMFNLITIYKKVSTMSKSGNMYTKILQNFHLNGSTNVSIIYIEQDLIRAIYSKFNELKCLIECNKNNECSFVISDELNRCFLYKNLIIIY
jgi:WD40 repeat protein